VSDRLTLVKPGIVGLVLGTTLAGQWVATAVTGLESSWNAFALTALWTLLGTGLTAAGAAALNNYCDRELDRLMARLYTALKRRTPWAIGVGGVTGALPPLIGWVGATGRLDPEAWTLFGLLFLWQLPHFWALALHKRSEYERAGLPVLPLTHGEDVTWGQIVLHTGALARLPAVALPGAGPRRRRRKRKGGRLAMPLDVWLPALNTALIGVSGVALLTGFVLIKRKRVEAHKRAMLTATVFAALFLIVYVMRWALLGSKPFTGEGAIRVVYFAVLISHIALAIGIVPLVLLTLRRALRQEFAAHRRLARLTLPLWLYVVITGWIVYALLYGL